MALRDGLERLETQAVLVDTLFEAALKPRQQEQHRDSEQENQELGAAQHAPRVATGGIG